MRTLLGVLLVSSLVLLVPACDATAPEEADQAQSVKGTSGDGKADASAVAVFLDFRFDGELYSSGCWSAESKIEDQLLYTIGHLNGDNSVGRLDQLVLTDIETQTVDGECHITYQARLPVAWGKKNDVPETYELILPRDVSYSGLGSFTESYSHDCVDWGAHDVTAGSMWYYYRPHRYSCDMADEDVVRLPAAVELSPIGTTGKYPEYHKVWEDGSLQVVAVFGKYEKTGGASDAGVKAYSNFVAAMRDLAKTWPGAEDVHTTPADLPSTVGTETPDVTFVIGLPGGRVLQVVALMVDDIKTAGSTFDERYETLTPTADLIVYNGHAGLGANVKALASRGEWATGQYAVVFVNGCDTFAYIDSALADAHMAVNDDDEVGTKYLDIVTNAMPSFFSQMPTGTMAMLEGLLAWESPRTYEQIFTGIDSKEVVLVSGEQDNVYVPGYGDTDPIEPDPEPWAGLNEEGSVERNEERRFETPTLPAGTYRFEMSGTSDADLYVRVGEEPTFDLYDCRPWSTGSEETCEATLSAPTVIHVMVTSWTPQSTFHLIGAEASEFE